ncbi:hypothetical protein ABT282_07065 [Streptomyces sp. NPDC000927]|uniref:hypothetical protein n=1 Tax=Streptomyces sp. NPDC000927 TaxID=3154371 RepID=UPI003322F361
MLRLTMAVSGKRKGKSMPKVEVEIMRTRRVTIDESAVVELDVPQKVIDDDSVLEWVEEKFEQGNHGKNAAFLKVVNDAMDHNSEDEEIDWESAYVLD